jgi:hypothetical protein
VAERAAEVRIVRFDPPEPFELDPPWATVALKFEDGTTAEVQLGRGFDVDRPPAPPMPLRPGEPPPPPQPRTEPHRIVRVVVDGGPPDPVEVSGDLYDTVEDLFREYGRKRDRDAEKRLDEVHGTD